MKKKLRVQGLSFREELEGGKIDFNGLVYLSLVPFENCNWNCIYCHQTEKWRESGEMGSDEMKGYIRGAAQLGAKALLYMGGEITLPIFWGITEPVIEEAEKQGLISLFYMNGSGLTRDKAKFLADHGASIALKLDSLDEGVYDRLTGVRGSFRSTMEAIDMLRSTSIGEIVYENGSEKLVRLLFTTVGNALNVNEYVSLARFATNNGARWMMESLNYRGNASSHPELILEPKNHYDAMQLTMFLNPEQDHDFTVPCRLLSGITIRKRGDIAICPQDYDFSGNIRDIGSLEKAYELIRKRSDYYKVDWDGRCPVKYSAR
jgi:MoaA/NifB/PqqE/SkfB family radical SAM enzyme